MKDKTFSKEDLNNVRYLNYIDMVCLDDVEPENQPWLWQNVIPLCGFTLFAGIGGIGKSQLLMFIAARVSDGAKFSAAGIDYQLPQGSVLILSSEDSSKYALSPRLRAQGANMKHIYKINSVINSHDPFQKRLMALDQDLILLKNKLSELKKSKQPVKLIIIDPVINFIGKTKDYINTEVSNFLYGLTQLAEEFELSIILNKHLRKKDSSSFGSALDEVAGSLSWVNTARQVWVICVHPDDEKKICFLDGKSNIKAIGKGMAFNIKPTSIVTKTNKLINTSRIEWLDEIIDLSLLHAFNKDAYEKSKQDHIEEFIINYLKKHGQSLIKDINLAGIKAGMSERTIRRAYTGQIKEGILKKERGFSGYTLRILDSLSF